MLISWFRWLGGYVRIRLRGYSPERFLNLCRARNIEIWELKSSGLSYEMNVSIRDFWKLKPLRKKARAHVEILERHGLPFFLYRNRSRKMFPAGILLCAVFLYVMSLFIWNIHIEGNYSRTTDVILDYLETEQVVHGMRKSQVDCKEIQSMLRIEFPDIVGAEPCIRAVDEVAVFYDPDELFFQRKDGIRFSLVSFCQTHRHRNAVAVHEQTHLYQGIWLVIFRKAIFSESFNNLACIFIHGILVGSFNF